MSCCLVIHDERENLSYYGSQSYFTYRENKLIPSIQYLVDIGKYMNLVSEEDKHDFMRHDCNTEITAEEFKKFCKLYADDLEKYYQGYNKEWFLEDENIKKLLESKNNKILFWI